MGDQLTAAAEHPPTTEQSPLSSTNSVAADSSSSPLSSPSEFSVESLYRAVLVLCDQYQLDKKQVALGVFLSFLLIVFSIGTVVAWNRYSPIIQEFIIKENIEKARTNKSSEKN